MIQHFFHFKHLKALVRLFWLAAGFIASTLLASLAAHAEDVDYLSFETNDEANSTEIFRKASPAVVSVTSSALRRNRFSLNVMEIPRGAGSGFIWNSSGLVVTNFHVIAAADKLTVTLNDEDYPAEVVGIAPERDLAVLRLTTLPDNLSVLPLGDSSELSVGRKVLAIGNPFGLDTTLTVGVVSALDREIKSPSNRRIKGVIQTDAAINPGNSGGPLLNSLGQLIGVNSQTINPGNGSGIGFAIPVNTVKKIVPQLLQYGREIRPQLGVRNTPDGWARQQGINGLPVYSVVEGTPAAAAGMLGFRRNQRGEVFLGDVIIEVDGQQVITSDDLLNVLEQHEPGDTVSVTTLRNQQTLEFEIELAPPG